MINFPQVINRERVAWTVMESHADRKSSSFLAGEVGGLCSLVLFSFFPNSPPFWQRWILPEIMICVRAVHVLSWSHLVHGRLERVSTAVGSPPFNCYIWGRWLCVALSWQNKLLGTTLFFNPSPKKLKLVVCSTLQADEAFHYLSTNTLQKMKSLESTSHWHVNMWVIYTFNWCQIKGFNLDRDLTINTHF